MSDPSPSDPSRRKMLQLTALQLTGLGLAGAACGGNQPLDCPTDADPSAGQADPAACITTGDDILGPYYLAGAPERVDLDVNGEGGLVLDISGVVVGSDCETAVAGAVIEVWQANEAGNYDNHSADMAFRATVTADNAGAYSFRSVLPGRYLNRTHYRPRHIHFRVTAVGFAPLITQLYFCGDQYIIGDRWAEGAVERTIVLAGSDSAGWTGVFDIVLAG
jgi:catechol 1,2-dioxygenase